MHQKRVEEIFDLLGTSERGLSRQEAKLRLSRDGPNELDLTAKVSPLSIFLRQFTSPLIWLLGLAVIISLLIDERIDALLIGIIVLANAIIGFFQEFKAERAIEALQRMASPKAHVLRDGIITKIDSKYVVPGDVLILEVGDKVAADARLIEIHELETQEASLTGESTPVIKNLSLLAEKTPLADRSNTVFAATSIINGRGRGVVTFTGMNTEVGRIARLIEESGNKTIPLQEKIGQMGKWLTGMVLIIAAIIFLTGIVRGIDLTAMFLITIALAVAAIPEGLPAIITISLALGVQKMVRRQALIRKLPSVETLGSVNVICTDKTGTLTLNQMTVTKIWANHQVYTVSGTGYETKGKFCYDNQEISLEQIKQLLKPLLNAGVHCNNAKLLEEKDKIKTIGDPTEAALLVSGEKAGLVQELPRVDEITFTSERKMMTTLHLNGPSFTKGAPEVLLNNCDRIMIEGKVQRLDYQTRKEILQQNETFASEALRVLGFAYKEVSKEKIQDRNDAEKNMIFLGLQAMIDPPREGVKESIQKCKEAGIRVIMITGDHLATAKAIAEQLGIEGKAIEGKDLEKINLVQEIDHLNIFARVNPEDKLKIVKALKRKGFIVAMTGDGINDAPALKKADIGIAMGIIGTDVAKEASDMILMDDNFTSIVNAIEEGRGVFDNIRKFVNYLLSCNLGEVLIIFLATLMGLPLPLTALQLLWINLVTDGFPAIALGLDKPEDGIMKRKPRDAHENLISRNVMGNILSMGIIIGLIALSIFWLYRHLPQAQTMVFTSIVIFEVLRLQIIRSQYKLPLFSNKLLIVAVFSSLILLLVVLYTPLSKLFNLVALGVMDWLVIVFAGLTLIAANFIISKFINRKDNS